VHPAPPTLHIVGGRNAALDDAALDGACDVCGTHVFAWREHACEGRNVHYILRGPGYDGPQDGTPFRIPDRVAAELARRARRIAAIENNQAARARLPQLEIPGAAPRRDA
jgi:hypothetical protein